MEPICQHHAGFETSLRRTQSGTEPYGDPNQLRLILGDCKLSPAFRYLSPQRDQGRNYIEQPWPASLRRLIPTERLPIIKGFFNGIDAILIAIGNDWRAIEAGARALPVEMDAIKVSVDGAPDRDTEESVGETSAHAGSDKAGGSYRTQSSCSSQS